MRSRNARRSAVRPPPCGYLILPAYRDNHHLSAPRHHADKLSSLADALQDWLESAGTSDEDVAQFVGWSGEEVARHREEA
jgi:hypothetical protein